MKRIFSVFAIAILSGCAFLTSPKENPVIEDHVNAYSDRPKIGVLSTTAERREVIFKMPANQFCSEAPPDVAESLLSSLSLLAQGSGKDATATMSAEARLEFAKTLQTTVKSLFHRTQGAQVFRDGSFSLCEAYLNGILKQEEYIRLYESLLKTTQELIIKEIPQLAPSRAESAADNATQSEDAAKLAAAQAKVTLQEATLAADRADAASKVAKQAADRAEAATKK